MNDECNQCCGTPVKPDIVARFDLDEPYYPDTANTKWKVTVIHVIRESNDTFAICDQDGDCLNPCVPYCGQLPTLGEVLNFLIELE